MRWLKKNRKLLLLILTTLILFLVIVFSFQNMDRESGAGGALQQGASAIQEPLSKVSGGVRGFFGSLFHFQQIEKENQRLKDEISQLKKENIENALSRNELEELRNLSAALDYTGAFGERKLVTADVISMDGSNWFNLFTINRGSESGIKVDSIAVSGEGLVGRIIDTGQGWSKVMGIIDKSNKVSFKVLRDQSLLGILQGDGLSALTGYMLDGKASIIEGDVLVTTEMGLYPEGLEIGKIKEIKFDNDTQLKNVTIEPIINFKNIQKVAVIL